MSPAASHGSSNTSKRDFHASQNTLELALGSLGGQRKPWMAAGRAAVPVVPGPPVVPAHDHSNDSNPPAAPAGTTRKRGRPPLHRPAQSPPVAPAGIKRKRGRPPLHRPAQSPPVAPASPSLDTPHSRHPASNSTSPHLPNLTTRRHFSPPRPYDNVLPSPAPSEENHGEPDHRMNHQSRDAVPGASPNALATATCPEQGAHQQVATTPTAASECTVYSNDQPRQIPRTESRPATPTASVISEQAGAPASRLLQHSDFMRSRPVPSLHTPPPSRATTGPQPIQSQALFAPPSALSSGRRRGNAHPPYQAVNSNAAPGTPLQNMFDLVDLRNAYEGFCLQHRSSPLYPRDQTRLIVLGEAIANQDWPYLTIHQYYSQYEVNPTILPPAVLQHPNITSAYAFLSELLDGNRTVSPPTLRFFAGFPLPLAKAAIDWPQASLEQQHIVMRLADGCVNYDALREECYRRRFPPLPREMSHVIGVTSFVLQKIIFTAVLRRFWTSSLVPANSQQIFEAKIQDVFCQAFRAFLCLPQNQDHHFAALLHKLCLKHKAFADSLLPINEHRTMQHGHLQTRSVAPTHLQNMPQMRLQPPQPQMPLRGGNLLPTAPAHGREVSRVQGPHIASSTTVHDNLLLPTSGFLLPHQRVPHPCRFALHEAGLRSPVLRAREHDENMIYHYFTSFARSPSRLEDNGHRIEKWTWSLSAEALQALPRDILDPLDGPPTRAVDEKSYTLRLRCVEWRDAAPPDEHTWAIQDTAWIPFAYFTCNGQNLRARKKLHYGKDLPIDITSYLKEGDNNLEIAVVREPGDQKYLGYMLAIEILAFKSHKNVVRDALSTNFIPAAESLATIMGRLSPSDADDEEVAVVEPSLAIDLFDPFSARICDLPARSRLCRHADCFDLETFLQTRKRSHDASTADTWTCPVRACKADARPHLLVVDGFLRDVRRALEERGLRDTRYIVVDQTGDWKPKEERRESVRQVSAEATAAGAQAERRSASRAASRSVPANCEVIDLSD